MTFAHDTTAALVLAADLVNTQPGRAGKTDGLPDTAALEHFLDAHQMVPRSPGNPAALDAVRMLRSQLLAAWETMEPAALAGIANDPGGPDRRTGGLRLRRPGPARRNRTAPPVSRPGLRCRPHRPVAEPVPPVLRHRQLRQPAARRRLPRAADAGSEHSERGAVRQDRRQVGGRSQRTPPRRAASWLAAAVSRAATSRGTYALVRGNVRSDV